ncbi:hypothetical protein CDAR_518511 [Caerostris darwini]|uniref:Uncharacterized protein n=1 Tax=Caerostris darwini TaxID=1538125 RepID=A0AAV4UW00_9ARAC|nr:hypothetical protein CDAR_518511 [Caerostris darwini]
MDMHPLKYFWDSVHLFSKRIIPDFFRRSIGFRCSIFQSLDDTFSYSFDAGISRIVRGIRWKEETQNIEPSRPIPLALVFSFAALFKISIELRSGIALDYTLK